MLFHVHSDWSLKDAAHADDLDERLALTSVSQPLIFAIQSASTAALKAGPDPAYVLGHSVGEIAAAEAAGMLSLEERSGSSTTAATIRRRRTARAPWRCC